jgi:hypothetical protein
MGIPIWVVDLFIKVPKKKGYSFLTSGAGLFGYLYRKEEEEEPWVSPCANHKSSFEVD